MALQIRTNSGAHWVIKVLWFAATAAFILYIPTKTQTGTVVDMTTGFQVALAAMALNLAMGILMSVRQLEGGRYEVENAYARYVTREGNLVAQSMINQVFKPVDRQWRGIGNIPLSGLGLNDNYKQFDASSRFDIQLAQLQESPICIAGSVLRGTAKPIDCPAFGTLCTPANPLGAPMVSGEGACSAYYRYHKVN